MDFYSINFIYKKNTLIIQSKAEEKMEKIITKFLLKIGLSNESLLFLYSGTSVNKELTLKELLGENFGKLTNIKILVYPKEDNTDKSENFNIKSEKVICPECQEDIRLKIQDYKICLYDCKNGHQINDISFNEFDKTQEINLLKIICDSCKITNKGMTYNNKFYKCLKNGCEYNLCPICKGRHDKSHIVIDYEKKDFICKIHNDLYIKYCKDCKINLCLLCLNAHEAHKIDSYEKIIPDNDKINNEIKSFRESLNQFGININEIISKLIKVKQNLEIYYNIYKNIIDNYINFESTKRNYEVYTNVNDIKKGIIDEINYINTNNSNYQSIKKILEIYDKMFNKNISNSNTNISTIVTCEKCHNIPKIIFLTNNKVEIDCSKCKSIDIKDISYFDRFKSINKDLLDLPNCSFNEQHNKKAVKYCFQCKKFLCNECIKAHNNEYQNTHILIEQKIDLEIYCNKNDHNNSKFNRYCRKCEAYLCSKCKCEHEEQDQYNLCDSDNDKKIKKINENLSKCEKMIIDEEKKLNNYIEEIDNKNETLKYLFKKYKERNIKIISLYKLLISNYEIINKVGNYNIENNIFINDNFDISNSNFSLKLGSDNKECISSIYNKLYNFYWNKNHIRTSQFSEHFITNKLCNRKIKKYILLNNEITIFIFEKENKFLYLNKKESTIKEISFDFKIKDIYSLKDNIFLIIDDKNYCIVIDYDGKEFTTKKLNEKFDFILNDLFNKENFFAISNNDDFLEIKYCFKNNKYNKFYKYSKPYKNSIICSHQKSTIWIEILLDDINLLINESKIKDEYKEQLNNIVKSCDIKNKTKYEILLNLDKNILDFINSEMMNLNVEIDIDSKNKTNTNVNDILYKLKLLNKEKQKSSINIDNILDLNKLFSSIREFYFYFLAINCQIYNIYNFKNENLIFVVEEYLLIDYSLKNKTFSSSITPNFIPIEKNDYKNFEIKYIYFNIVILININDKNLYLLEKFDDLYRIKNTYKFYSNIIGNNNYLIFDTIKDNIIEFSIIDLSQNTLVDNNELNEIFKYKIPFYIPKILAINNRNNFILLYEENQICIIDSHYLAKKENKIIEANKQSDEDKENDIKNKNSSQILNKINKIKIKEKEEAYLIPKIFKHSPIYSDTYDPSYLFTNDDYYYCSLSNDSNHFIVFDFEQEFNFSYFKIICYEKETRCRPKKFSVVLFDNKYRRKNELLFIAEKGEDEYIKYIREKARYLAFIFQENFTGKYFIIKNIEFYSVDDIC